VVQDLAELRKVVSAKRQAEFFSYFIANRVRMTRPFSFDDLQFQRIAHWSMKGVDGKLHRNSRPWAAGLLLRIQAPSVQSGLSALAVQEVDAHGMG